MIQEFPEVEIYHVGKMKIAAVFVRNSDTFCLISFNHYGAAVKEIVGDG